MKKPQWMKSIQWLFKSLYLRDNFEIQLDRYQKFLGSLKNKFIVLPSLFVTLIIPAIILLFVHKTGIIYALSAVEFLLIFLFLLSVKLANIPAKTRVPGGIWVAIIIVAFAAILSAFYPENAPGLFLLPFLLIFVY